MVRPESVALDGSAGGENRIEAKIEGVAFAGASTMATAVPTKDAGLSIKARLASRPDGMALQAGRAVTLVFAAEACRLVPT
jgi:spermidine/putrescine transport system ATP-binding protein